MQANATLNVTQVDNFGRIEINNKNVLVAELNHSSGVIRIRGNEGSLQGKMEVHADIEMDSNSVLKCSGETNIGANATITGGKLIIDTSFYAFGVLNTDQLIISENAYAELKDQSVRKLKLVIVSFNAALHIFSTVTTIQELQVGGQLHQRGGQLQAVNMRWEKGDIICDSLVVFYSLQIVECKSIIFCTYVYYDINSTRDENTDRKVDKLGRS